MTIKDKTPLERAAMTFKSAGLGDRSAREAARLLFESGISFESAAVLGQRMDEACTATPASIREAANRYDRARNGPATKTGWGRPLEEASSQRALPAAAPKPPRKSVPQHHPEVTKVIDGVLHYEVVEYETVRESADDAPRRSPWGRKLEG